MPVSHASLGLISLVFLSGSLVLLFFVILSAVTPTPPLDNTYFLQADTSSIAGARPVTQWTYFYICGAGNTNCTKAIADPPLGYAWQGEANATGAPAELVGSHGGGTTSSYYYYMWRFGWVFYLISLVFEVVAFFVGFLACCGRLGSALSGFVTFIALFFYTIAVSLMTATFVKARDAFVADGHAAQVGKYAFGFSWGAWAALLIAAVLFCVGSRGEKSYKSSTRRRHSTRSKRSYEMNSRRVKDEYP